MIAGKRGAPAVQGVWGVGVRTVFGVHARVRALRLRGLCGRVLDDDFGDDLLLLFLLPATVYAHYEEATAADAQKGTQNTSHHDCIAPLAFRCAGLTVGVEVSCHHVWS